MEVGHAKGGPVEGGFPGCVGKKERLPQEGGGLAPVGFSFAISDPLGSLEMHGFLTSQSFRAGNMLLVLLRVCFHR